MADVTLAEQRGAKALAALFNANVNVMTCQRCKKTVYTKEKVTSSKDVIFHKSCFTCSVCGTPLTTATHKTSVNRNDPEVYCVTHVPKLQGKSAGLDSRGILNAVEQSKLREKLKKIATLKGPSIGPDAQFISHPLSAQGLNKYGGKAEETHMYPALLLHKRDELQEKLRSAQEALEMQQREEEQALLNQFQEERDALQSDVKEETEQEWENRLKNITKQLDKQYKKKQGKDYEQEKEKLEDEARKDIENKHTQKLRNRTLKVIAEQQEKTSALVEKQSSEMLDMMQDRKKDLEGDLEELQKEIKEALVAENIDPEEFEDFQPEEIMSGFTPLTDAPPPAPPRRNKNDIYHNLTANQVFNDLDDYVVNIAETEQTTFTELVKDLTGDLMSDLAKARAIFRWITIKDLNTLQFNENLKDTPLGLLKGIKFGTETYHTLFKRLCSYSGLHCVEIKGRSKSVGYEPGMRFEGEMFRNTWNAVLIDGEWRLVQCNWGARHLVLNKDKAVMEMERTLGTKKKDKIRYQYDEHYFLCDPLEFIQEFFPDDPKWQLLEHPLNLPEFEDLPFVRSVFFHFGMMFKEPYSAVLRTGEMGGAEIRIKIPDEVARDIVFHYQLRFAPKELRHETEYKGAKLDRFVFQSMLVDEVIYSVHLPVRGQFFLEIFANKINDGSIPESSGSTMPVRLKCASKFKIVCDELKHKMHALPNCASGEWGPAKAIRHFRLHPKTHSTAVINAENEVELRFTTNRALHFLVKLRTNGVDDHFLDQFVKAETSGEELIILLSFPQAGQYGLDLYARPDTDSHDLTLAHACKYLINVTKVRKKIDLGPARMETAAQMVNNKYGMMSACSKLGIKPLTHKEGKLKQMPSLFTIEFAVPDIVALSYHFIREPDEEYRDHVTLARVNGGHLAKFTIDINKPGNYLLAIYGRKDGEDKISNVYNYLIVHDPEMTLTRKKKSKDK
ncbi:hillarin-like isoform X2 [Watersipora subatra]|uniref:hillarin-like isoform X2 n=1 Tax=Watersipora subatra TaxID=2589382 RepID=UPI00355C5396